MFFLEENDLKILVTEFPAFKWKNLTKKLAYPHEYFNSLYDCEKQFDNLKKEDFFKKLKNYYPNDKEIERTKESIKLFNIKNGEKLTEPYSKSVVLLLACVFEKFIKKSINKFGINPLNCVSLPDYTRPCALKYTGINIQSLQDKDLISTLENNIRGGINSVLGERYVK